MKSIIPFKTMFYIALFFCTLLSFETQAQSSFYSQPYNSRNSGSYGRGDHLLSLGYGVPNWLYTGYGAAGTFAYGSTRHIGIGPMMLKYEFPIRDEVGLGFIFQGATKSWKFNSGGHAYRDRAWGTGAAFMGYYHFNKLINVPKMDVYAGLGVNFTYQKLTRDAAYYNYYYGYYGTYYYDDQVQSDFDVRPCGVVGIRYYVAPRFAFAAEAGYTTFSSLNLGITFKL
jgi:hypothetical protein